jgi:hypothetical protein
VRRARHPRSGRGSEDRRQLGERRHGICRRPRVLADKVSASSRRPAAAAARANPSSVSRSSGAAARASAKS